MQVMEACMRSALILAVVIGFGTPAYAQVAGGSFMYARLGYGTVLADGKHASPAFGFGFRGELDAVAVDMSFLNFIVPHNRPLLAGDGTFAGSLFRLQVLRFLDSAAERSLYVGGGISYARVSSGGTEYTATGYTTGWEGTGMQGEATVGYELTRSSPMRIFVQADAGLPLFKARQWSYSMTSRGIDYASPAIDRRYTPSVALTLGIGWRRR